MIQEELVRLLGIAAGQRHICEEGLRADNRIQRHARQPAPVVVVEDLHPIAKVLL
ncbi:hypothetical protein [Streptomyces sp. NPDC048332]|uniref:hypothetical protein n=1 Tax=Streptomyces sp. NPDC048332 TaxID=3154619 RepID=UPI00342A4362